MNWRRLSILAAAAAVTAVATTPAIAQIEDIGVVAVYEWNSGPHETPRGIVAGGCDIDSVIGTGAYIARNVVLTSAWGRKPTPAAGEELNPAICVGRPGMGPPQRVEKALRIYKVAPADKQSDTVDKNGIAGIKGLVPVGYNDPKDPVPKITVPGVWQDEVVVELLYLPTPRGRENIRPLAVAWDTTNKNQRIRVGQRVAVFGYGCGGRRGGWVTNPGTGTKYWKNADPPYPQVLQYKESSMDETPDYLAEWLEVEWKKNATENPHPRNVVSTDRGTVVAPTGELSDAVGCRPGDTGGPVFAPNGSAVPGTVDGSAIRGLFYGGKVFAAFTEKDVKLIEKWAVDPGSWGLYDKIQSPFIEPDPPLFTGPWPGPERELAVRMGVVSPVNAKSGNDLLSLLGECDPGATTSVEVEYDCVFAYGLIAGTLEGYQNALLTNALGEEPELVCAPEGANQGQARRVVQKYLEENPELLHGPAAGLVLNAFMEVGWDCSE